MIEHTYLSNILNDKVTAVEHLTKGQIGEIYRVETTTNTYLLKTSDPSERLPTEARMLEDMYKNNIAVPRVIDHSDVHILMTYIEEEAVSMAQRDIDAADILARLHSITNESRMYGYWYDTTIGPFPQKNEQTQYNWTLFLSQMRIMPMARICYDKGVLPKAMLARLERLCHDLYKRIDMSLITPSLIHGDLWSGNILFNGQGATLIDPALYFADREMELAFILMFDTFGETFFEHYTRTHPLSEDFHTVKLPLYQIYPYLVHTAIYGSSYLSGLEACLEHLNA